MLVFHKIYKISPWDLVVEIGAYITLAAWALVVASSIPYPNSPRANAAFSLVPGTSQRQESVVAKMSGRCGPQEFTDVEVQTAVHEKRDDFIAFLHERQGDILALAASHHPTGAEGQFFREPARGTYNICFFVKFRSANGDWDKWVVRIPLRPCLAFGARTKVESEIATMEYNPPPLISSIYIRSQQ